MTDAKQRWDRVFPYSKIMPVADCGHDAKHAISGMPGPLTITENGALFVAQHSTTGPRAIRPRLAKTQMRAKVKLNTFKIARPSIVLRWLERMLHPRVIMMMKPEFTLPRQNQRKKTNRA